MICRGHKSRLKIGRLELHADIIFSTMGGLQLIHLFLVQRLLFTLGFTGSVELVQHEQLFGSDLAGHHTRTGPEYTIFAVSLPYVTVTLSRTANPITC